MHAFFLFIAFVLAAIAGAECSDWPQWRGPERNGLGRDGGRLFERIPEQGLRVLWESVEIPSGDEGGLGSPVVWKGRVYLGVVWHRDVPSETRQIDELVLRQIGHQSTGGLGKDVVAAMEEARINIPASVRGKKLDEFAEEWIATHLDRKQKQLYSGFVSNRFKKGPLAIPLDVLEILDKQKERVFSSEAEMRSWLEAQGWSETVREQIASAVPPTKRVAEDVVMCLELVDGKTLWMSKLEGLPVGRSASATVCVADGKVFSVGSSRVWCVDAENGRVIWEKALVGGTRGVGGSPLYADGVVVVNVDGLLALDAASGKELWSDGKAGGGNSSPALWRSFVISNGRNEIHAIDLKSGSVAWTVPGGGDSTPTIAGDILAVQTRKAELGLVCYRLQADSAVRLWNIPIDAVRTQASAIIHEGVVYLMDDNTQYCVDIATGAIRWQSPGQSTISSPVLADGKIFLLGNNGNSFSALKATAEGRVELGRATVRAQWVPSPCIADGKLVLRMKDRLKCWSLTP